MNSNNIKLFVEQRKKEIVVVLLVVIIIVLLGIIATKDNKLSFSFGSKTRTIMIYMAGNNLETDATIATADLNSIIPNKINFKKTNILVYTGSTKKWHNDFIKSNENAIFQLQKNGYQKIKTYPQKSLGEIEVFKEFLNYTYENYKTDKYDLIFWDHGAGALGSINDEYSNDMLYVTEMRKALAQTEFKNKKLETILFRTCLNGTMEVANELSPFAEYMIASEEITRGYHTTSVLNFINNIDSQDNGIDYGRKFITSYQQQIKDIEELNKFSFNSKDIDSTYSIIDLTKITKIKKQMNDFFKDIKVQNNYNTIARTRSKMHQYAKNSDGVDDFDTIDLYELIYNLKDLSPNKGASLLKTIKETIKYNWSTNSHSNGLSIYMPYYGTNNVKKLHLQLYDNLKNFSEEYNKFIKEFYNIQTTKPTTQYSFLNNKIQKNDSGKEVTMELTKEQQENFGSANYIIFQKNDDNYFTPIYVSSDISLDENGILKTNLDNNLLKIVDKETNEESYIQAINVESINNKKEYNIVGVMFKIPEDVLKEEVKMVSSIFHIKIDENNKPYISEVLKNESASSQVLNVKDYQTLQFGLFRYKILDSNGVYQNDWQGSETKYLFEVKSNKFELKRASLDNGDNYYCVFRIKDTKNNVYNSNIIKIK